MTDTLTESRTEASTGAVETHSDTGLGNPGEREVRPGILNRLRRGKAKNPGETVSRLAAGDAGQVDQPRLRAFRRNKQRLKPAPGLSDADHSTGSSARDAAQAADPLAAVDEKELRAMGPATPDAGLAPETRARSVSQHSPDEVVTGAFPGSAPEGSAVASPTEGTSASAAPSDTQPEADDTRSDRPRGARNTKVITIGGITTVGGENDAAEAAAVRIAHKDLKRRNSGFLTPILERKRAKRLADGKEPLPTKGVKAKARLVKDISLAYGEHSLKHPAEALKRVWEMGFVSNALRAQYERTSMMMLTTLHLEDMSDSFRVALQEEARKELREQRENTRIGRIVEGVKHSPRNFIRAAAAEKDELQRTELQVAEKLISALSEEPPDPNKEPEKYQAYVKLMGSNVMREFRQELSGKTARDEALLDAIATRETMDGIVDAGRRLTDEESAQLFSVMTDISARVLAGPTTKDVIDDEEYTLGEDDKLLIYSTIDRLRLGRNLSFANNVEKGIIEMVRSIKSTDVGLDGETAIQAVEDAFDVDGFDFRYKEVRGNSAEIKRTRSRVTERAIERYQASGGVSEFLADGVPSSMAECLSATKYEVFFAASTAFAGSLGYKFLSGHFLKPLTLPASWVPGVGRFVSAATFGVAIRSGYRAGVSMERDIAIARTDLSAGKVVGAEVEIVGAAMKNITETTDALTYAREKLESMPKDKIIRRGIVERALGEIAAVDARNRLEPKVKYSLWKPEKRPREVELDDMELERADTMIALRKVDIADLRNAAEHLLGVADASGMSEEMCIRAIRWKLTNVEEKHIETGKQVEGQFAIALAGQRIEKPQSTNEVKSTTKSLVRKRRIKTALTTTAVGESIAWAMIGGSWGVREAVGASPSPAGAIPTGEKPTSLESAQLMADKQPAAPSGGVTDAIGSTKIGGSTETAAALQSTGSAPIPEKPTMGGIQTMAYEQPASGPASLADSLTREPGTAESNIHLEGFGKFVQQLGNWELKEARRIPGLEKLQTDLGHLFGIYSNSNEGKPITTESGVRLEGLGKFVHTLYGLEQSELKRLKLPKVEDLQRDLAHLLGIYQTTKESAASPSANPLTPDTTPTGHGSGAGESTAASASSVAAELGNSKALRTLLSEHAHDMGNGKIPYSFSEPHEGQYLFAQVEERHGHKVLELTYKPGEAGESGKANAFALQTKLGTFFVEGQRNKKTGDFSLTLDPEASPSSEIQFVGDKPGGIPENALGLLGIDRAELNKLPTGDLMVNGQDQLAGLNIDVVSPANVVTTQDGNIASVEYMAAVKGTGQLNSLDKVLSLFDADKKGSKGSRIPKVPNVPKIQKAPFPPTSVPRSIHGLGNDDQAATPDFFSENPGENIGKGDTRIIAGDMPIDLAQAKLVNGAIVDGSTVIPQAEVASYESFFSQLSVVNEFTGTREPAMIVYKNGGFDLVSAQDPNNVFVQGITLDKNHLSYEWAKGQISWDDKGNPQFSVAQAQPEGYTANHSDIPPVDFNTYLTSYPTGDKEFFYNLDSDRTQLNTDIAALQGIHFVDGQKQPIDVQLHWDQANSRWDVFDKSGRGLTSISVHDDGLGQAEYSYDSYFGMLNGDGSNDGLTFRVNNNFTTSETIPLLEKLSPITALVVEPKELIITSGGQEIAAFSGVTLDPQGNFVDTAGNVLVNESVVKNLMTALSSEESTGIKGLKFALVSREKSGAAVWDVTYDNDGKQETLAKQLVIESDGIIRVGSTAEHFATSDGNPLLKPDVLVPLDKLPATDLTGAAVNYGGSQQMDVEVVSGSSGHHLLMMSYQNGKGAAANYFLIKTKKGDFFVEGIPGPNNTLILQLDPNAPSDTPLELSNGSYVSERALARLITGGTSLQKIPLGRFTVGPEDNLPFIKAAEISPVDLTQQGDRVTSIEFMATVKGGESLSGLTEVSAKIGPFDLQGFQIKSEGRGKLEGLYDATGKTEIFNPEQLKAAQNVFGNFHIVDQGYQISAELVINPQTKAISIINTQNGATLVGSVQFATTASGHLQLIVAGAQGTFSESKDGLTLTVGDLHPGYFQADNLETNPVDLTSAIDKNAYISPQENIFDFGSNTTLSNQGLMEGGKVIVPMTQLETQITALNKIALFEPGRENIRWQYTPNGWRAINSEGIALMDGVQVSPDGTMIYWVSAHGSLQMENNVPVLTDVIINKNAVIDFAQKTGKVTVTTENVLDRDLYLGKLSSDFVPPVKIGQFELDGVQVKYGGGLFDASGKEFLLPGGQWQTVKNVLGGLQIVDKKSGREIPVEVTVNPQNFSINVINKHTGVTIINDAWINTNPPQLRVAGAQGEWQPSGGKVTFIANDIKPMSYTSDHFDSRPMDITSAAGQSEFVSSIGSTATIFNFGDNQYIRGVGLYNGKQVVLSESQLTQQISVLNSIGIATNELSLTWRYTPTGWRAFNTEGNVIMDSVNVSPDGKTVTWLPSYGTLQLDKHTNLPELVPAVQESKTVDLIPWVGETITDNERTQLWDQLALPPQKIQEVSWASNFQQDMSAQIIDSPSGKGGKAVELVQAHGNPGYIAFQLSIDGQPRTIAAEMTQDGNGRSYFILDPNATDLVKIATGPGKYQEVPRGVISSMMLNNTALNNFKKGDYLSLADEKELVFKDVDVISAANYEGKKLNFLAGLLGGEVVKVSANSEFVVNAHSIDILRDGKEIATLQGVTRDSKGDLVDSTTHTVLIPQLLMNEYSKFFTQGIPGGIKGLELQYVDRDQTGNSSWHVSYELPNGQTETFQDIVIGSDGSVHWGQISGPEGELIVQDGQLTFANFIAEAGKPLSRDFAAIINPDNIIYLKNGQEIAKISGATLFEGKVVDPDAPTDTIIPPSVMDQFDTLFTHVPPGIKGLQLQLTNGGGEDGRIWQVSYENSAGTRITLPDTIIIGMDGHIYENSVDSRVGELRFNNDDQLTFVADNNQPLSGGEGSSQQSVSTTPVEHRTIPPEQGGLNRKIEAGGALTIGVGAAVAILAGTNSLPQRRRARSPQPQRQQRYPFESRMPASAGMNGRPPTVRRGSRRPSSTSLANFDQRVATGVGARPLGGQDGSVRPGPGGPDRGGRAAGRPIRYARQAALETGRRVIAEVTGRHRRVPGGERAAAAFPGGVEARTGRLSDEVASDAHTGSTTPSTRSAPVTELSARRADAREREQVITPVQAAVIARLPEIGSRRFNSEAVYDDIVPFLRDQHVIVSELRRAEAIAVAAGLARSDARVVVSNEQPIYDDQILDGLEPHERAKVVELRGLLNEHLQLVNGTDRRTNLWLTDAGIQELVRLAQAARIPVAQRSEQEDIAALKFSGLTGHDDGSGFKAEGLDDKDMLLTWVTAEDSVSEATVGAPRPESIVPGMAAPVVEAEASVLADEGAAVAENVERRAQNTGLLGQWDRLVDMGQRGEDASAAWAAARERAHQELQSRGILVREGVWQRELGIALGLDNGAFVTNYSSEDINSLIHDLGVDPGQINIEQIRQARDALTQYINEAVSNNDNADMLQLSPVGVQELIYISQRDERMLSNLIRIGRLRYSDMFLARFAGRLNWIANNVRGGNVAAAVTEGPTGAPTNVGSQPDQAEQLRDGGDSGPDELTARGADGGERQPRLERVPVSQELLDIADDIVQDQDGDGISSFNRSRLEDRARRVLDERGVVVPANTPDRQIDIALALAGRIATPMETFGGRNDALASQYAPAGSGRLMFMTALRNLEHFINAPTPDQESNQVGFTEECVREIRELQLSSDSSDQRLFRAIGQLMYTSSLVNRINTVLALSERIQRRREAAASTGSTSAVEPEAQARAASQALASAPNSDAEGARRGQRGRPVVFEDEPVEDGLSVEELLRHRRRAPDGGVDAISESRGAREQLGNDESVSTSDREPITTAEAFLARYDELDREWRNAGFEGISNAYRDQRLMDQAAQEFLEAQHVDVAAVLEDRRRIGLAVGMATHLIDFPQRLGRTQFGANIIMNDVLRQISDEGQREQFRGVLTALNNYVSGVRAVGTNRHLRLTEQGMRQVISVLTSGFRIAEVANTLNFAGLNPGEQAEAFAELFRYMRWRAERSRSR